MSSTNSNTTGKDVGEGIKGVFAAAHGVGETIRGTFNSAVDQTFEKQTNGNGTAQEGVARNEAITRQGLDEIETGKFSTNTKQKELTKEGSGI